MRRRKLVRWRHSSHCNGGSCVEVTQVTNFIVIRDSGGLDQTVVMCSPLAWQRFVKSIRIDTPIFPGCHHAD
jgi:hypothetical protein